MRSLINTPIVLSFLCIPIHDQSITNSKIGSTVRLYNLLTAHTFKNYSVSSKI